MISTFIKAQWESHQLECMDNERRQIFEEAAELDDDVSYVFYLFLQKQKIGAKLHIYL